MVDSRATLLAGIASLLVAVGGGIYAYKTRYKPPPVEIARVSETLPRVLIIGDSISIGYAPTVREQLKGIAFVQQADNNAQSTTFGLKHLHHWARGEPWDVIYFNFGLHDLARDTGPDVYKQNLIEIGIYLKTRTRKLIFATTTDVPEGHEPFRPHEQGAYANAASEAMASLGIETDDLNSVEAEQPPMDVHFTDDGYVALGRHVANTICASIKGQ